VQPGTVEEGNWVSLRVKMDDGRMPEYIFLHFGCLNMNNVNYVDWYSLYRVPPACEWIYISAQRMKKTDKPAAKALAICPKRERAQVKASHTLKGRDDGMDMRGYN
jgi:hypothetical protein